MSLGEEAEPESCQDLRRLRSLSLSPTAHICFILSVNGLFLLICSIGVWERGFCILEKTDLTHTWFQYQIPESEFHCSACVQLSTVKITGSCQTSVASRRGLQ